MLPVPSTSRDPLRKPRTSSFGILKFQQFVTEFRQDDSFISHTSSVADFLLTEIAPLQSQPPLHPKSSRADFATDIRGTKRRGTMSASPGRVKRVFSGISLIGNKENGLLEVGRRACDSPVQKRKSWW